MPAAKRAMILTTSCRPSVGCGYSPHRQKPRHCASDRMNGSVHNAAPNVGTLSRERRAISVQHRPAKLTSAAVPGAALAGRGRRLRPLAWVKIKASAVKIDRGCEVRRVAKAAGFAF